MVIDYEKQAEKRWGATDAYKEYKEKSKGRGTADNEKLQQDMMNIFAEFAKLNCAPADEPAQQLVAKLQGYITDNFYHCTNEILAGLGKMYVTDGEFKTNNDGYAGEAQRSLFQRQLILHRLIITNEKRTVTGGVKKKAMDCELHHIVQFKFPLPLIFYRDIIVYTNRVQRDCNYGIVGCLR